MPLDQPIPIIAKFMTAIPISIESSRSLKEAHELMRSHRVRHLPVIDAGALVGLLSLSDLHLIESLKDVDPEEVQLREAMSHNPFAVSFDARVDEVADAMAERKIGSAVVTERGRVVGIFTSVDAFRALAAIIRDNAQRGVLAILWTS